ncbi:MAG TPA: sulfite exporter TauE/SafE family protein [Burkholderiaceae bacterium]|nr:sulfite exporter TauE/SafE family protein [Burkholderiaceae bacterium]
MEVGFIAALVLLGAGTGFAAGLLGIGGGMLMVPFLTLLFTWRGFPLEHIVHMAIATSLATILFTSVSSVRAHHQRGAVLWPVVRLLAPGILLGSLIGAQIAGRLPTFWLSVVFATFVGFSALQMLLDRKPRPTRELPKGAGMFGVGSGIGFISSLVGAGGGFISVPFMVWSNVKIHNAVATSAALGFPIAAAGTLGYILAGHGEASLPPGTAGFVYLPALLAIAAASVLTAPLGARVAHSLDTKPLKRVFAILLFLLAGYMAYKGARAY